MLSLSFFANKKTPTGEAPFRLEANALVPILAIPKDIFDEITKQPQIDLRTLGRMKCVCKRWNRYLNDFPRLSLEKKAYTMQKKLKKHLSTKIFGFAGASQLKILKNSFQITGYSASHASLNPDPVTQNNLRNKVFDQNQTPIFCAHWTALKKKIISKVATNAYIYIMTYDSSQARLQKTSEGVLLLTQLRAQKLELKVTKPMPKENKEWLEYILKEVSQLIEEFKANNT